MSNSPLLQQLLRIFSRQLLSISREGESTTSLVCSQIPHILAGPPEDGDDPPTFLLFGSHKDSGKVSIKPPLITHLY